MYPLKGSEGMAMKKAEGDSNKSNHNARWVPVNRPGVIEFIRAAENFEQAGKFVAALEQLARAQKLEPNNKYIAAIMERVENLRRNDLRNSNASAHENSQSSLESDRYLSITVGHHFDEGIKPADTRPAAAPDTPFSLVKELTDIAEELANLGLAEPAFDALMKAYLLDPLSPDVLTCEKRIVPLWNSARTQRGLPSLTVGKTIPAPPPPAEPNRTFEPTPLPETDEVRVEALRQQKEMERLEKEREVWREASRVPRIFRLNPWDDSQRAPSPDGDPPEPPLKFFRKRRTKE